MKKKLLIVLLLFGFCMSFLALPVYAADFTYYSQHGWKNNNGQKLSGMCYLTSISMLVSDLVKPVTPVDVYYANGGKVAYQEGKITQAYGLTKQSVNLVNEYGSNESQKRQVIADLLSSGQYPVGILVLGRTNGVNHMVVAREVINGVVYCDDPSIGQHIPIDKTQRVSENLIGYWTLTTSTSSVCNHVKGEYLWPEQAHPHYQYYKCSICGKNFTDGSTTKLDSCSDCQCSPPVISISEQNAPDTLNLGQHFGLRGIVSTDRGVLTEVWGAILDSNGNIVQQGTYYPNEQNHNLHYSINNDLIFNKLVAGNYTYKVIAKAANGECKTEITLIEKSFIVGNSLTISISGQNAPGKHKRGTNFGIRGIVSTDRGVITTVYGAILDMNGNVVQSGTYYPNEQSHNLRNSINNDLIFEWLSAGTYIYRVEVTAKNGNQTETERLIDITFTVEDEGVVYL